MKTRVGFYLWSDHGNARLVHLVREAEERPACTYPFWNVSGWTLGLDPPKDRYVCPQCLARAE